MRSRLRWVGVLALAVAGCGGDADKDARSPASSAGPTGIPAREQAQALAQLLAAFDAHGGLEGFAQLQRCRLKSEITVFGDGGSRRLIWEDVFAAPDSLWRRVLDADSGELLRESVFTAAGHWGREPGAPASELPHASVEALLPAGVGMLRLLRRAQQPEAQLTPAPAGDGLPLGAKVLLPKEPETTFSFDPQSRLVTRVRQSDRPRPELGSAVAAPVALEIELSEVRDWHGLKIPAKAVARRGGQKLFELTLLEVEPLERIDPATFRRLE
jgi:hypothetical protein